MPDLQDVRIGIVGFGTVGAGVVECLLEKSALIGERTGIRPVIQRVADLDLTSDRGVLPPPGTLTNDAAEVTGADDIDVVVELVGGTTVARHIILDALEHGKPVVTANKALLAEHGEQLFEAAARNGTDLYYEGSVGGGIPVIKAIREGLVANRLRKIVGILNGTCNYILTRMEEEYEDFDAVLADAQKLGYAEADPGLDIDGLDAAHKAVILAAIAYGDWFGMEACHVEGIRGMALQDVLFARDLGYRIKLLAIIKEDAGAVQIRVHPALVPVESQIGSVSGVFNAVLVQGDTVGDTLYYGRGAGRAATASAVVADIVDVGLNLKSKVAGRVAAFRAHRGGYETLLGMDSVTTRYYLRLQVADEPGVLAQISGILGRNGISIASLNQHEIQEPGASDVPLVILTHRAVERNMQAALAEISALAVVAHPPVVLRIEDLQ